MSTDRMLFEGPPEGATQPNKTPPQPPPSFDIEPWEVLYETEAIITSTRQLEDHLANELTTSTATFQTLLMPLLRDDQEAACRLLIFRLFGSVSEDPDLREASERAEQEVAKASAVSLMRQDIAALVSATYDRHRAGEEPLDDESAYKLFKMHREYQKSGASITDEALRQRFVAAVEEQEKVRIAAKKTLSEADDGVWFSRGELDGVPQSLIDSLQKDQDGELRVTFKRGHILPVMKHAWDVMVRATLYHERNHRFPENVERLERLIILRDATARMLGFTNHAALKMEDKMASDVESVMATLKDLKDKLLPMQHDEIEALLDLKKFIRDTHPQANNSKLEPWDWSFHQRILEEGRYSVDSLLLSEYLEVENTLNGMLRIFEKLFGMAFVPIDAPTWHDKVTAYAVWDSQDEGGGFLGYLYLDLYARKAKSPGAHCSLVQPGFTKWDGTRHYPASALICNIIRSPFKQPTLLQHSELKTMFHELGHAIHKLVTRTKYSHGCARDFVEIPSIMLENWAWVPEVLVSLGRHYSYLNDDYYQAWMARKVGTDRPREDLSMKLATDLARTKYVNGAHAMLHQVFLALFDLTIHSPASPEEAKNINTTRMWNEMKAEASGMENFGGIGNASFAHPFRGYDAAYFTYPLSRVYATDLWVTCFKADPMDQRVGRKYRRCVLEPGGSQPEATSLKNFLGRDPTGDAYQSELEEAKRAISGRQISL